MTRPPLRLISFLLALGSCMVATGFAGVQLQNRPRAREAESVPIYLPQARFLRPLSLGYHNVLANLLWFRTISYFGEHYRSDHTYPWLAYMCDLVTDLDPRADYVYRFAGMILTWEANRVDEGIRLLEKGTKALPNSWLLHYWLGFTHYFFKEGYDQAITHLRRAAELPGAHPSAAALAALLHQHQYGPATTMQFLQEMAKSADTDEVREVVRRQIHEAQFTADVERLTAAVASYQTQTGHTPASLQSLVEAGILSVIPSDPFGGIYEIDPVSGAVRSSTGHRPLRLYRSKRHEAAARGEPMQ